MAKNKKISAADEQEKLIAAGEENQAVNIADKLREAQTSINRASSDAKARMSEKEKEKENSKNEAKEKLAEAKRRQEEYEKQAKLVAEQKQAAFEYAENYRRKLMKDKERALSKAKRRQQKEAEEALVREREEKAKEIERLIELEREEARARSERAMALLESVTKRAEEAKAAQKNSTDAGEQAPAEPAAPVEEATPKASAQRTPAPESAVAPSLTESEKSPVAVGEADKAAAVEKNALTDEERLDAVLHIYDEDEPEEPAAEEKPEDNEFIVSVESADDLGNFIGDSHIVVNSNEYTYKESRAEEENKPEEKKIAEKKPEPKKASKEPVPAKNLKEEKPIKVKIPEPIEYDEEQPVEPEPPKVEPIVKATPKLVERDTEITVLDDDVVRIIKDMGKRVENKKQLKRYLKKSDKAVRSLEGGIKKTTRKIEKKVDENDAPGMMVEVIKASAKILEIRCDNLAVCARIGIKKYTKKYTEELRSEINAYNAKTLSYNSMTGEDLTRISAFLPEEIAAGTGSATIPKLSYRESYVEMYVGDDGEISLDESENDNVTMTVVSPSVAAAELLGNALIETSNAMLVYGKRVRRADKEFVREIAQLRKEIDKNEKKNAKLLSKENCATVEFKAKMTKLEDKTPPSKRNKPKYQKRAAKITKKYSARINEVKFERETLASERKNTKLLFECLALERERLIIASAALRGSVENEAKEKVIAKAKRHMISVMLDYNRTAFRCSDKAGIELTRVAGSTVDDIAKSKKTVVFPKVAYRRELTETVGDEVRIIGDRLRPHTTEQETLEEREASDVFADTKTTHDRGATLETLLINDLREKSLAVNSKWSVKKYFKYSKKVRKKLTKTLKETEHSIIKAFDKNDVVFSLVEALRVRGKLIELGTINLALANKLRLAKQVKKETKPITCDITVYNERAIDYATLTGEQFNRISVLLPAEIGKRGAEILVPSISYRESYIEVYPKDATVDMFFPKPNSRSATDYIPLAFKNRRLTENRSVEVTIINSPHIAEEYLYGPPATKVIHHWFSEGMSDLIEVRLKSALKKVKRRIKKNDKLDREFEVKLAKLGKSLDDRMFIIESTNQNEKSSDEYKQKLALANKKFSKEISKLRIKRAAAAIERKRIRLTAEQFVIEREFLVVACRKLFILRSYGWRGVLRNAKREVIERIDRYNTLAKKFAEMLGEPIALASTAIADDIIKYGKTIVFPYVAMCKELIETIAGKPRIIGEKYRGSMRMGVDVKGNPVIQQFPTTVPEMATKIASPTVGVDAYGEPVIGATHSGLIYMGGDLSPELNAQFIEENAKTDAAKSQTGDEKDYIVTPYDAIKAGQSILGIPSNVSSEFFEPVKNVNEGEHKLGFNGSKTFPINPLANEIEEYAVEAIKAQSRTITTVGQWYRHLFRSWLARKRLKSALNHSKKKRLKIRTREDGSGATNLERANKSLKNFYMLQEMVAEGMIVEIRSANLYAIARLGIWWRIRIRTRKLKDEIEKYNEYISEVSGVDEFDLTSVSLLLADNLAAKTGVEKIPRMHIKESFLEVDSTTVGNAMPILPTISAERNLEEITVNDKESFLYYRKRAEALIDRIDSQTAKYSKVLKKRINKLRWFRRRKMRATARYHRRIFDLSCKMDNTVKYQKKLHRIKRKYSKHFFKITRRETMPLNSLRLLFFWRKKYSMCSYIGFDDIVDFARLRDFDAALEPKREVRRRELEANKTLNEAKDAQFINTLTKFSLNAEKNRLLVERKYARRRERRAEQERLRILNMRSAKERWYRFGHWILFLIGKRDEAFIGRRDPHGAPLENTPERNILTRVALEREKLLISAKIYAELMGAINTLKNQMADFESATSHDAHARAQYKQDKEDIKHLRRMVPKVTREFSTVLSRYNFHIGEASYSLRIPITQIDNAFIKNIETNGTVPEIPRLAWRGEIIETVGETERNAGERLVM